MRPEVPGACFIRKCAIMNGVMHMKKVLAIIAAVIILAAGAFLWKGGHHAIMLAGALEDWLDADGADQHVTVQLQQPTAVVDDNKKLTPVVNQMTFTADTFWTEYRDDTVYGLTSGGASVYIHEGVLYLDSGKAYSLPQPDLRSNELRELLTGLLLYGRVRRTEDGYTLQMKTEELSIKAAVSVDRQVTGISLQAELTRDGEPLSVLVTVNGKERSDHSLPQAVLDAMVLARMEKPQAITEPLNALLPALEDAFPLEADGKLSLDCGILTLSEAVGLTIDGGQAALTRDGASVELPFNGISPVTAAIGVLGYGEYTQTADGARFVVKVPAELTAKLVTSLVPQAADLGITFQESEAVLTITDEALTGLTMTAGGSVPFLVTTIPLTFSAEFDIH